MTPETIPDATGSTPVAWQDGQPFSPRYGDRYHTQSGARAQAEHVFLGGCVLPDAWSVRPPGTAGNDLEHGTSGSTPGLGSDRNSDTTTTPSGPDRWTILETGFGLGLNFLSAWACWQASPVRPTTLRFVSTEAHPVSAHDIRRAGADDPRLQPLAERLAGIWPDAAPVRISMPTLRGGVNLSIRQGEHLSILGPNGAGKSTLALTLAGLLYAADGTL
ncbi:MAG: ATP-binding cassette domain-containing protein, partial [Lautropia mirabilis]